MPVPKWIVGAVDSLQHPARVRRGELVVVPRAEDAGPGVEELDHVGAGVDLRRDVGGEALGEALEQRVPDLGLAVHQLLGGEEVAAAATLDEVARDRERRAAEADQRLLRGQLPANEADGLERLLRRSVGPQAVDVGRGTDRVLDHRAHAFDELDVEAHGQHRRHDVREENGGIDAVTLHRLERHLRAELRRSGQLEEAVTLSQRPVLGKRTPRLAHEPHRRALDRLAAAGADEKRLWHGRTLVRCRRR